MNKKRKKERMKEGSNETVKEKYQKHSSDRHEENTQM